MEDEPYHSVRMKDVLPHNYQKPHYTWNKTSGARAPAGVFKLANGILLWLKVSMTFHKAVKLTAGHNVLLDTVSYNFVARLYGNFDNSWAE